VKTRGVHPNYIMNKYEKMKHDGTMAQINNQLQLQDMENRISHIKESYNNNNQQQYMDLSQL